MSFNSELYLQRIGGDAPAATPDGLADLHDRQSRAIAFENIDPLLGRLPPLDAASLESKILRGRRGGWCLELNSLLGMALSVFGFRATPVLGRVRMGELCGGPRAHLAWIVEIDGRDWLADVGFGGPGFRWPLLLGEKGAIEQESETFRLIHDPASGEMVVERQTDNGWFGIYGFDRTPVTKVDIEAAGVVCARWDSSPFPVHLMMNRWTPLGRIGVFNACVTERRGRNERKWTMATDEELKSIIADRFGIALAQADVESIAGRLGLAQARGAA